VHTAVVKPSQLISLAAPLPSRVIPVTVAGPCPQSFLIYKTKPMTITVDLQPNCRATAHITVPADRVSSERQTVLATIAKSVSLPGFRPGKVPASVVAKKFKDSIQGELEQSLINAGLREAVAKQNLRVLSVLRVPEKALAADDTFTFSAELILAPEVTLPEYKGIPVKLETVEVSDHDVEHELYHLRERASKFDDVERAAGTGDIVVLSYICRIDGTPTEESMPELPPVFKKMEASWFKMEESDNLAPGFVEGILGINKDEKRSITCTIGDDFHNESLRGKAVEFDVECSAVKEQKLAELNDELAAQFMPEGTVETLKVAVREAIEARKNQGRDQALSDQIIKHLDEQLSFEIPQEIVNQEAQRRTNEITMRAARQGVQDDAIMGMQEQIVGAATEQAKQSVKASFILAEVARRENIEVSDNMILNRVATMAAQQRQQPKVFLKELQKRGLIDRIREDLLLEAALGFLKGHAVVEELAATAAEPHGSDFEKGAAAA
jgi:trigger factor